MRIGPGTLAAMLNLQREDLRPRVERGVLWLDTHEPGWRDHISPADLNMADCSKCVLGQVFGDFTDATVTRGISKELSVWLGFNLVGDEEDWERLRLEWLRVIKGEE